MRAIVCLLVSAWTVVAAEPTVMVSSFRDDGTLLVSGKPVLPYGFYISTRHTGDIRLKCVEQVHKIGGTVVHIEGPWHEDTRFLDKAAQLGIWVVAGHTETEAKLERVRKYRDHPAIIAWTLYDDANTLSNAAHLEKMNRLVKAIVPHRLTYIPLGRQSRAVLMPGAEFFGCSDFVGWEMYPIANAKSDSAALVSTEKQMRLVATAARAAKRPYWMLPQSFKWPGGRVPTPIEYRNMCYVGLINGAKGIMPWSIYHMVDSAEVQATKKAEGKPAWEEWYLPDSMPLWAECERVASEFKTITPMILNGTRTKLDTNDNLSAALWTNGERAMVVVANLSETAEHQLSLTFPSELRGEWQPTFENRKNSLKIKHNSISGPLAAGEVAVYQLR